MLRRLPARPVDDSDSTPRNAACRRPPSTTAINAAHLACGS
jgi:hypothetical protein